MVAIILASLDLEWKELRSAAGQLWDASAFKAAFTLNGNIFIRSSASMFVATIFTVLSSGMGTTILTENALLLQVVMLSLYFFDGIGFATETLTGNFKGKEDSERLLPVSRSKGGSNRVGNLTIACHCCNQAKGNLDVKDFLSGKPDVLKRVLAQIKKPMAAAAAVNTTRWALFERLKALGLPVETGTGGQTKFNRARLGLIKTHWTDAVAVGSSTPEQVTIKLTKPLMIKATGYGHRRMCNITKFGFPQVNKKGELAARSRVKVVYGFQTGDMVRAVVPKGKNAGTHVGRVTVRSTGQFDISTATGKLQIINHKYCKPIHRQDGYSYS